jgi:hypothetical protein
MVNESDRAHPASFRDPDGFIFTRDGIVYRQINQSGQARYMKFTNSGLYQKLVDLELLIAHSEEKIPPAEPRLAFQIIRPEAVTFISYPYEWSFSQLRDAALVTLNILKLSLDYGMILKDASAYNIQFVRGKPVLIDTLSFDIYQEGVPWDAYRQFCQHFLAPLALMANTDVRLSTLLRSFLDGIPLDLASRLLPASTRLNFGLLTHIHMHASAQKQGQAKSAPQKSTSPAKISKTAMLGLIDSLESTVQALHWKPGGTSWGEYYTFTNYSDAAFNQKKELISQFLDQANPKSVWDLGANDGTFSRLASQREVFTAAFDIDPAAVENNYLRCKQEKDEYLLPLLMDLTNPSPATGWELHERMSFLQRGPVDCILALAIIHHLAISNNLPLSMLAAFFARNSHWLVIEFVPKNDSQAQKLLATRLDIFGNYTQENFETIFSEQFTIIDKKQVAGSERWLYLMEKRKL